MAYQHGRRSGGAPTAGCQRRPRSRTHTHRSSVKRLLSGARLTNAIIAAQSHERRQNPPAGRGNRRAELAESRTRFLQGRAAATMSGRSMSTHVRSSKPGTGISDTPEDPSGSPYQYRNSNVHCPCTIHSPHESITRLLLRPRTDRRQKPATSSDPSHRTPLRHCLCNTQKQVFRQTSSATTVSRRKQKHPSPAAPSLRHLEQQKAERMRQTKLPRWS